MSTGKKSHAFRSKAPWNAAFTVDGSDIMGQLGEKIAWTYGEPNYNVYQHSKYGV